MTDPQMVTTLAAKAREGFGNIERLVTQCRATGNLSHKCAQELFTLAQELSVTMGAFFVQGEVDIVNLTPPSIAQVKSNKGADYQKRKATSDSIRRIFKHWQRTMDKPVAKLNEARVRLIHRALIKWQYDEGVLIDAIDGCAMTPHNMGIREDGKPGQAYNDLELIFRDASHIERFAETAQNAKEKAKPKEIAVRTPRLPLNLECPICAKYRRLNQTEQPNEICPNCWEEN